MRFVVALLLTATAAYASPQCADHAAVTAALKRQFGEEPQAMGATNTGWAMELFENPQTGTWTITMTDKAGITCLMSAGDQIKHQLPGDPA